MELGNYRTKSTSYKVFQHTIKHSTKLIVTTNGIALSRITPVGYLGSRFTKFLEFSSKLIKNMYYLTDKFQLHQRVNNPTPYKVIHDVCSPH